MQRIVCTAACLLAGAFSQQVVQTDAAPQFVSDSNSHILRGALLGSSVSRAKNGNIINEYQYENIVEKIVEVSPKLSNMSMSQQALMLHGLADEVEAIKEGKMNFDISKMPSNEVYDCQNRVNSSDPTEAFRFLPIYDGLVTADNPFVSWEGLCYESISMTFNQTSVSSFDITFDLQGKRSFMCKEAILIANTEISHFELFFVSGKHKISFNMPGEDEQLDVAYGGIKAFSFCEHFKEELESLVRTISLWVDLKPGQHFTQEQHEEDSLGSQMIENANLRFINVTMGWDMEPRAVDRVYIDPNTIRSGDYFTSTANDGLASIIMYGSGAYVSHNVMALWFEEGLYIVESTDPVIKRTPWEQYLEENPYMICHLPLTDEKAAQFNETAAREFFFEMEGVPYGYHNFLYGWIDTPEDNLPPMLPHHFVPILYSYVEMIDKKNADMMFTEALNLRLGVQDKNITEIAAIAAQQSMSVEDVMAMVEKDSFRYTGLGPKDGRAYVCSAFVTAMFKAAGLFDGYEINAAEFSPADVYRLNFFDLERPRPQACIDADPDLPYCQISGKYKQILPFHNTVEPFSHMYERCPSVAPEYYRPDGC